MFTLFLVGAFHISLLLALLQEEGLLVENEVVEDGGVEHALQHHQIPNHLTSQEDVLQLLVLYEVVEPLLSEAGHAAHLEKVRRFEAGHLGTACGA